MHTFAQLPRTLAVDDSDMKDAELAALLQILWDQIADFTRLEQVQVEHAVYGPRDRFVGWTIFSAGHGNGVNSRPQYLAIG